ncbi:dynein light chain type 1 domain-containing protein [Ditylenchus destructor]|uniref:Dynein light chain type 1 domain-containing protein n=1 Tax=Ditylenchus destructor TaxID=166010 RepID=A0AAD4MHZ6_9BILA|nr:dynein light chain type 1 domain-containing protein [Ditylenchus destructor]
MEARETRDFALSTLTEIRKKHSEESWARRLQQAMDDKYAPAGWNCLMGRDFTTQFFNHEGYLLVFGIGEKTRCVLFKMF